MTLSFDTNVLIDSLRSAGKFPSFTIYSDDSDEFAISSVVVSELESGARTRRARRELEEGTVGDLLRESAIEAPNDEDWIRTGRLLAQHPEWARTASRQNDVLLALQCARLGWTLVTRDADFRELSALISRLQVAPPRPL